jgi:hypothetical protein
MAGDGSGSEVEEDWRPPEARVRAALWEAEGHLERRQYVAAARALERVLDVGGELIRALHHLAAAGYKAQEGHDDRARRQLAHARRRLAPFLPEAEEVDLAALVATVEADVAKSNRLQTPRAQPPAATPGRPAREP